MNFYFYPHQWPEAQRVIEDAGYHLVDSLDDADVLVYNGRPDQFPETLPETLGYVQFGFAGIDAYWEAGLLDPQRRWANAAGIYADTVAESALAALLAVLHMFPTAARAHSWEAKKEIDKGVSWLYDNKTVAIIGAGGIGVRLLELLKPFGVSTIAVNRSGNTVPGADETVPFSEIDTVWNRADYFVLIAPLTDETRGMINTEVLEKMPQHAVIVNVGRGSLVVTDDLVDALQAGTIAGAALDVTDPEPLPDSSPLWDMDNVLITPHTANTTERIHALTGPLFVRNAQNFADGKKMITEIDPIAGY